VRGEGDEKKAGLEGFGNGHGPSSVVGDGDPDVVLFEPSLHGRRRECGVLSSAGGIEFERCWGQIHTINVIAKWTVIRQGLSCSWFFLKTWENQMLNSEGTAGRRDVSPDAHPLRVFWQGYRAAGVTGTKAVAAEYVVDQKVRIQNICFPKLQKAFLSLFRALVLPELLPRNPLVTFSHLPLALLAEWDAQGSFSKEQAVKACKNYYNKPFHTPGPHNALQRVRFSRASAPSLLGITCVVGVCAQMLWQVPEGAA